MFLSGHYITLVVSIVLLATTLVFGYEFSREVVATQQMEQIDRASRSVLIALLDAETGQRGYIITGNQGYLVPYQAGSEISGERLADLMAAINGSSMLGHANQISALTTLKLKELALTIQLRHDKGFTAAQTEVNKHLGKNYMDEIRIALDQIEIMTINDEKLIRDRANLDARLAFVSMIGTLGCMCLFSFRR